MSTAAPQVTDEQVRDRLKQADKLSDDMLCLECGYKGPMAVSGGDGHWNVKIPLFIVAFFLSMFALAIFGWIGCVISWAALFWIGSELRAVWETIHCPACQKVLSPK